MASCTSTLFSYFYLTLNVWVGDTDNNRHGHRLDWELILHHNKLDVNQTLATVWINGEAISISAGGRHTTGSGYNWRIGSGSKWIWHDNGVNIGFSFNFDSNWTIGGKKTNGMSASGSIWLDGFAVAPTPPNSVSVSGGNSGWLSINNPTFNVSWSGASAGTYTITQYNIDVTKNNWASITTPASLPTSNTYGSLNNVSASSLGLSGGETVRVRVAMMTSRGDWLLSYWGGSFRTYSNPTSPTTFNVPSSQEIDTAFNITWSGASAGSNGIAGYDLEIRAYNGSSWTDWVRLLNCKNQTSYSSGSPKSLNVNGVSYANNGENVQFQYRLRTSDGIIATSDWVVKTMKIFINSPTDPRK